MKKFEHLPEKQYRSVSTVVSTEVRNSMLLDVQKRVSKVEPLSTNNVTPFTFTLSTPEGEFIIQVADNQTILKTPAAGGKTENMSIYKLYANIIENPTTSTNNYMGYVHTLGLSGTYNNLINTRLMAGSVTDSENMYQIISGRHRLKSGSTLDDLIKVEGRLTKAEGIKYIIEELTDSMTERGRGTDVLPDDLKINRKHLKRIEEKLKTAELNGDITLDDFEYLRKTVTEYTVQSIDSEEIFHQQLETNLTYDINGNAQYEVVTKTYESTIDIDNITRNKPAVLESTTLNILDDLISTPDRTLTDATKTIELLKTEIDKATAIQKIREITSGSILEVQNENHEIAALSKTLGVNSGGLKDALELDGVQDGLQLFRLLANSSKTATQQTNYTGLYEKSLFDGLNNEDDFFKYEKEIQRKTGKKSISFEKMQADMNDILQNTLSKSSGSAGKITTPKQLQETMKALMFLDGDLSDEAIEQLPNEYLKDKAKKQKRRLIKASINTDIVTGKLRKSNSLYKAQEQELPLMSYIKDKMELHKTRDSLLGIPDSSFMQSIYELEKTTSHSSAGDTDANKRILKMLKSIKNISSFTDPKEGDFSFNEKRVADAYVWQVLQNQIEDYSSEFSDATERARWLSELDALKAQASGTLSANEKKQLNYLQGKKEAYQLYSQSQFSSNRGTMNANLMDSVTDEFRGYHGDILSKNRGTNNVNQIFNYTSRSFAGMLGSMLITSKGEQLLGFDFGKEVESPRLDEIVANDKLNDNSENSPWGMLLLGAIANSKIAEMDKLTQANVDNFLHPMFDFLMHDPSTGKKRPSIRKAITKNVSKRFNDARKSISRITTRATKSFLSDLKPDGKYYGIGIGLALATTALSRSFGSRAKANERSQYSNEQYKDDYNTIMQGFGDEPTVDTKPEMTIYSLDSYLTKQEEEDRYTPSPYNNTRAEYSRTDFRRLTSNTNYSIVKTGTRR